MGTCERVSREAPFESSAYARLDNTRMTAKTIPPNLHSPLKAPVSEFRYADHRVALFGTGQTLVAASEPPSSRQGPNAPPLPSTAVVRAGQTAGVRGFRTLAAGKDGTRVVTQPATISRQQYVAVAVGSLRDEAELRRTLGWMLLLMVPTALLLASGGGYLLARAALAPVEAMGREAAQIDLHARVSSPSAHDELGRLADAFNARLDQLESAFEQQRRFMADASHELRTPVAIVRGEADVALSKDRDPRRPDPLLHRGNPSAPGAAPSSAGVAGRAADSAGQRRSHHTPVQRAAAQRQAAHAGPARGSTLRLSAGSRHQLRPDLPLSAETCVCTPRTRRLAPQRTPDSSLRNPYRRAAVPPVQLLQTRFSLRSPAHPPSGRIRLTPPPQALRLLRPDSSLTTPPSTPRTAAAWK